MSFDWWINDVRQATNEPTCEFDISRPGRFVVMLRVMDRHGAIRATRKVVEAR